MKYLKEREEIALALNFFKFPVLRVNIETPQGGWEDLYNGDLVNVVTGKGEKPYSITKGYLDYSVTEGYFINPDVIGLKSDFGYLDVIEDLKFAQAPIINPGDTVIVIEDFPNKKTCRVRVMKVPEHCAKWSVPVCKLLDVPNEWNVRDYVKV